MYFLTGKKVPLSPENNPIGQFFDIIGQSSTGGSGYTWKIYDGVSKANRTVSETDKPNDAKMLMLLIM